MSLAGQKYSEEFHMVVLLRVLLRDTHSADGVHIATAKRLRAFVAVIVILESNRQVVPSFVSGLRIPQQRTITTKEETERKRERYLSNMGSHSRLTAAEFALLYWRRAGYIGT
jgi:hypothetical protein